MSIEDKEQLELIGNILIRAKKWAYHIELVKDESAWLIVRGKFKTKIADHTLVELEEGQWSDDEILDVLESIKESMKRDLRESDVLPSLEDARRDALQSVNEDTGFMGPFF